MLTMPVFFYAIRLRFSNIYAAFMLLNLYAARNGKQASTR